MWIRNAVFLSVCLGGLCAVGAGLFQGNRIGDPSTFRSHEYAEDDFQNTVAEVNGQFNKHWEAVGVDGAHRAGRADDLTIARRLSLGLTGVIPSLEEIRAFEAKTDSLNDQQRVQWWVSRLMDDRRYADHVAERFARAYVGVENGPFLVYRRRRFVTWLSDRFHSKDLGYDEIVKRLIADKGLWTDSPPVNFVSVTIDQNEEKGPDPIRLAGRTTRAFLGMRIDCLQCHDNNLPREVLLGPQDDPHDGLQQDFHQLAAFYSEASSTIVGIDDRGDEYKYKYLDEENEEVVPPAVPYSPEFQPKAGTRRQQLAAWVTHRENKPFSRAVVNRVWALMFGRPLVQPIDDIPLHGLSNFDERRWWKCEGDFPPGMEALADDFAAHGFDIPRLIRLIAATDVFQAASEADFEITPKHEKMLAVFPLTRLRPEQVAGAMIQSSSLKTIDGNSHIVFQLARFAQQNGFVQRYGDTGEDEFTERGGTIPQRLLMMNGELTNERTKGDWSNASSRIASLAPTDGKAIEAAFLTVLTRRPTSEELKHFKNRFAGKKGQPRQQQIEDLYWILLNTTEFSWNH